MAMSSEAAVKKVLSHLKIIRIWADQGNNHDGIWPECCEDVAHWEDDAISLIESLYTPNDAMLSLIYAGQHDKRFKIGDTIRYTPTEVYNILMEGKRKP